MKFPRKLLLTLIVMVAAFAAVACTGETPEDVSTGAGASTSADGKINLNNMTDDQLTETIPDFGGRMVFEFFEYQPYVSIAEFRREIGKYVDDDQVAEYETYIFVPIEINESDAATLAQIPGVDEALAETLISGRPYSSNEAFLTVLGESLASDEVDVAATYLRQ